MLYAVSYQFLVENKGKLTLNADKRGMQTHIPKALEYAKKYYDWERNAKKLAYMLFMLMTLKKSSVLFIAINYSKRRSYKVAVISYHLSRKSFELNRGASA